MYPESVLSRKASHRVQNTMAEIKSLSVIAAKWIRNASVAGQSYKDGVTAPRRSWAVSAAAADDARKAGLQAADARDAFREGVNAAGDSKWKNNATTLGVSRYPQGVQNAQPEYTQGFQKYHGVIAGVTLPPRGAKGSPENLQRVAAIAQALHAAKVS
jgi:hypothetical protein